MTLDVDDAEKIPTEEQNRVIERAVIGQENIFLTGKAGSGKSFTCRKIVQALREQCKIVHKSSHPRASLQSILKGRR